MIQTLSLVLLLKPGPGLAAVAGQVTASRSRGNGDTS